MAGFHQKCHNPPIPAGALQLGNPWKCSYCSEGIKCPFLTESLDALQNLLSDDNESVKDEPIDIQDEPVNVPDQPVNISDELVNVPDGPVNVPDELVNSIHCEQTSINKDKVNAIGLEGDGGVVQRVRSRKSANPRKVPRVTVHHLILCFKVQVILIHR